MSDAARRRDRAAVSRKSRDDRNLARGMCAAPVGIKLLKKIRTFVHLVQTLAV